MKSIISIIALFLLMSGISHAQFFNCSSETCFLNLTTSRWTCNFVECLNMPSFINQTNVTLNVTNLECNQTEFFALVEGEFNLTRIYGDCRADTEGLERDFSSCSSIAEGLRGEIANNYTSRSLCESERQFLQSNITVSQEIIEKANEDKLLFGGGCLIVGIISMYVFFIRKPSHPERTSIIPSKGETSFDPKKIDEYNKKQEQSYIDSLKRQVIKRTGRRRASS